MRATLTVTLRAVPAVKNLRLCESFFRCGATSRVVVTVCAVRGVNVLLSAHAGSVKEVAMSNYELFLFDYGVARAIGMDHWDSLWAGLAWVGHK